MGGAGGGGGGGGGGRVIHQYTIVAVSAMFSSMRTKDRTSVAHHWSWQWAEKGGERQEGIGHG